MDRNDLIAQAAAVSSQAEFGRFLQSLVRVSGSESEAALENFLSALTHAIFRDEELEEPTWNDLARWFFAASQAL